MIGGNTKAVLQVSTTTKNAIGEKVQEWHDVAELTGFLDMQSGDSKYTTFNAKIQESTHIFICDYLPISGTLDVDGKTVRVSAENARMVANSQRYDVMLIDNPMNLNKHLEFYLKFTGGQ
jgi:head-tail adaptor